MKELPGHMLPTYSEESREDTLFHYTTGNGLLGILRNNELWSTAYYCTNDESELSVGRGVLSPIFRSKTHQMIQEKDQRVNIFRNRGVDIQEYADKFEQRILSHTLHSLCVFITCFCKPSGKEDFLHGRLSQWRGYCIDGGYALQFSRERLQEYVRQMNKNQDLNYELQDVHYLSENSLKEEVTAHSDAFRTAYLEFLDSIIDLDFSNPKLRNPVKGLFGGPLESLLDYLIHTKNIHFNEENECRISVLEPITSEAEFLPVNYFNRNGLIIPYTRTPASFNILDCVDWIIVGPSPRIEDRFSSVSHMVSKMGLKIKVRPSHIPFSRT